MERVTGNRTRTVSLDRWGLQAPSRLVKMGPSGCRAFRMPLPGPGRVIVTTPLPRKVRTTTTKRDITVAPSQPAGQAPQAARHLPVPGLAGRRRVRDRQGAGMRVAVAEDSLIVREGLARLL